MRRSIGANRMISEMPNSELGAEIFKDSNLRIGGPLEDHIEIDENYPFICSSLDRCFESSSGKYLSPMATSVAGIDASVREAGLRPLKIGHRASKV